MKMSEKVGWYVEWWDGRTWDDGVGNTNEDRHFIEINETRIPSPDEIPEKALDLHSMLSKTVQIYDSNKQKWRFEVLTSRGVISYFCRLPEYAGIKPKTDA